MLQKWNLLLLFALPNCCAGQSNEQTYPHALSFSGDTFFVKFSTLPRLFPLRIGQRDTLDMGTSGAAGLYAILYYGSDSLRVSYTNLPYDQAYYIPFHLPDRKIVFRLHFNSVTASFPAAYMDRNTGKTQVEIPEAYELANIIWTLSPNGRRRGDCDTTSAYYQQVQAYFKPYLRHALFKKLDFPDSLYFKNYYDFRENSFTYSFRGNKLAYEGPYYYVMGDDWEGYNSLFRQLLPLVEDFARKSKFRAFYRNNRAFYTQQIERQKALLPLQSIWNWLEQQFPAIRYQSVKVVFSPLIGGAHSTQNFSCLNQTAWFTEVVLFVCGTYAYDHQPELSEQQKEGLMSGIVFTEIDHNYVNRISAKYAGAIDSVFSNRGAWVAADGNNAWYDTPMAVFNEYMTHAVYCLWVAEHYDPETANFVIQKREALMAEKRHFSRFRAFNQALLELHRKHGEATVVDLYPAILDWCSKQI